MGILIFSLCLNALVLLTTKEDEKSFLTSEEAENFVNIYTLHSEEMDAYYQRILEWDTAQELRWQEEMTKGNYYWEPETIPSIYAKDGCTDRQYFEWLFEWLNREEEYTSKIETVISNAHKNILELESKNTDPSSYAWKYQQKIITIYSSLKDTISFNSEIQHGWQQFFNNETVNVFIVLYVLIASTSLCMKEKSDGSIYLLHATKRGRLPVITAKLCVLFCWIGISILLFSLESLLLIGIRFGFSSPFSYIQELSEFIYCPYSLYIWQYLLIIILLKWVVFFAFAILVFLIGIIIPDHAIISISGLAIIGINVFLNIHQYVQPNNILKNINLQAITYVQPLFSRYKGVNLFGNVISMPSFALCIYLLSLLVLISTILILYNGRLPVSYSKSLSEKITINFSPPKNVDTKNSPQVSLFTAEFHKCFKTPLLLLITIVVLSVDGYLYNENLILPTSYSEQVYREYMTHLEGPLTEEKMDYIRKERAWIDSIIADSGEKKEEYLSGKIGVNEYTDYLIELYNAEARNSILAEVESYKNYILEYQSNGKEAWFVYDTGWKTLFSDSFDWGLYAILILISANIFPIEFSRNTSESSAANLIRCTKRGRNFVWINKHFFLSVIGIIVYILFAAVRLFLLLKTYTFSLSDAPIISLRFLNISSLSINILQFTIFVYVIRSIAVCTLIFFCCAISVFVRKQIPAILITAILSLFPTVASYFNFEIFSKYEYVSFFLAVPLLVNGDIVYILTVNLMGILLLNILSIILWTKSN